MSLHLMVSCYNGHRWFGLVEACWPFSRFVCPQKGVMGMDSDHISSPPLETDVLSWTLQGIAGTIGQDQWFCQEKPWQQINSPGSWLCLSSWRRKKIQAVQSFCRWCSFQWIRIHAHWYLLLPQYHWWYFSMRGQRRKVNMKSALCLSSKGLMHLFFNSGVSWIFVVFTCDVCVRSLNCYMAVLNSDIMKEIQTFNIQENNAERRSK